jgi:hypothetical protein
MKGKMRNYKRMDPDDREEMRPGISKVRYRHIYQPDRSNKPPCSCEIPHQGKSVWLGQDAFDVISSYCDATTVGCATNRVSTPSKGEIHNTINDSETTFHTY